MSVHKGLVFLEYRTRPISWDTPSSCHRKPFPFGEKKLADHVWECDVILGKQNSGILLKISSVQIKTSQDRALPFCTTQSCPVPGAWYGTDPVMWFNVWGSKRLPWVGLDCILIFRAGSASSGYCESHSSLLPGSWPHPEQFVLTGTRQKSQKHQDLQSYPKTFDPL